MYVPDSPSNLTNSSSITCPSFQQTLAVQISKTGLYVLIISLSLLGNTLVIFTIFKNHHMRNITNLFIANLACSDLLITFLGMPNMITQLYLYDKWIFGQFICKIVVFFQSVSVASSVLTLLAITKDRFVAIVFPFKPRMEFCRAAVILAIIWLTALGVMAPLLYAMRVQVNNQGYEVCVEDWSPAFNPSTTPRNYTVILFVCLYLIPLLTMAILYSIIGWKLWRRKSLGQQVNDVNPAQTAKKKVIKMLIIVVIVFAVCWLPLYVYQFIVFFALHRLRCFDSNYVFYFVSLFLCHANSAINPFLYALFNRNYREGFLYACRCFKSGKNNSSQSIVSITRNTNDGQAEVLGVRTLLRLHKAARSRNYSPQHGKTQGMDNEGMTVSTLAFTPKPEADIGCNSMILHFGNPTFSGEL